MSQVTAPSVSLLKLVVPLVKDVSSVLTLQVSPSQLTSNILCKIGSEAYVWVHHVGSVTSVVLADAYYLIVEFPLSKLDLWASTMQIHENTFILFKIWFFNDIICIKDDPN